MALPRISPGERLRERTSECSSCWRNEKISVGIDRIKTDAVGWLDGKLRPPR
jgi:hypothetical protein